MALPKAEGSLYLSAIGVGVGTARPGWRSRAWVVGLKSVQGATHGVLLDAECVHEILLLEASCCFYKLKGEWDCFLGSQEIVNFPRSVPELGLEGGSELFKCGACH